MDSSESSTAPSGSQAAARIYVVRVKGCLDIASFADWFGAMELSVDRVRGQTVLQRPVTDQAELYGLLARLRGLVLPLVSVSQVEPVAKKPAERVPGVNDDEKAIFIHTARQRVWPGADNEPEVELSLPGPEAFLSSGLPGSQDSAASPLPLLLPSAGSLRRNRATPIWFVGVVNTS
jgi:hypothetical protein